MEVLRLEVLTRSGKFKEAIELGYRLPPFFETRIHKHLPICFRKLGYKERANQEKTIAEKLKRMGN